MARPKKNVESKPLAVAQDMDISELRAKLAKAEHDRDRYKKKANTARQDTAKEILTDLKPILESCFELETQENAYVYNCKKYGIEVTE